jgi:hypothetical protein
VAHSSTGLAGALGVHVRRLQYLVAMYAARSRTSASGVGRSNVAPCSLITTLPIGGSSVSVLSPAVGPFDCKRVVVVRVPRSRLWVGWQPGFSDVPGPESLAVSSRCRHLHTGRMFVMAGLTVCLNFHAHVYMCKSWRDPGCNTLVADCLCTTCRAVLQVTWIKLIRSFAFI